MNKSIKKTSASHVWQIYVDDHLLGTGKVKTAAMIGMDGTVWAVGGVDWSAEAAAIAGQMANSSGSGGQKIMFGGGMSTRIPSLTPRALKAATDKHAVSAKLTKCQKSQRISARHHHCVKIQINAKKWHARFHMCSISIGCSKGSSRARLHA